MTTAEASAIGRDRRSFAAIPLIDDYNQFLGIFYVDAVPQNAWRDPALDDDPEHHPLYINITSQAREQGLIASLTIIMLEMRKTGPGIRVFK